MLSIDISSGGQSGFTFAELERYEIPTPPNGFDPEINGNVIMHFEDEQQALDYAQDLNSYANSINSSTTEYRIINDIIKTISNDEFVQAYIKS